MATVFPMAADPWTGPPRPAPRRVHPEPRALPVARRLWRLWERAVSRAVAAPTTDLVTLLTRCGEGDRRAFAKLYELTASTLNGRVLKLIKDRGLAEEVLQDTYTNVWRHAQRYDPALAAPLTWMTSIARYRAFAVLQQRKREEPLSDEMAELLPAPLPEPGEPGSLEARALTQCLEELEADTRAAIHAAYHHGLSYAEVAATMGVPEGTMKSRIRRALMRLKACLDR